MSVVVYVSVEGLLWRLNRMIDRMHSFLKDVRNIGVKAPVFAFFKACLLGMILTGAAWADLFRFKANEPINGFFAPFFNEQGQRIWQCRGEQVKYISDARIKIYKMGITFFLPEDPEQADMFIRSDKAVVSLPQQSAYGRSLVTLTNEFYTILGENWTWVGKQKAQAFMRVYIGKNASVSFHDERAVHPSTVITSEQMEMLRFKTHNAFTFSGNVRMKSDKIHGSADQVYVQSVDQNEARMEDLWNYGKLFTSKLPQMMPFILAKFQTRLDLGAIGQLRVIVARHHVFLETYDEETGEVKKAQAQKAVVYPDEGKIVLTENPFVHCSIQGSFRGGKITFYKSKKQVVVENPTQGRRSQVLLSE